MIKDKRNRGRNEWQEITGQDKNDITSNKWKFEYICSMPYFTYIQLPEYHGKNKLYTTT
jgi:hypothetical protein